MDLQGPLQHAFVRANITQQQARDLARDLSSQLPLPLENTMPATTKATRDYSALKMVESARLTMLIQDEYTSSDKSDDEFAQYASQKMGRRITEANVFNRRRQLGIQSKKDRDIEAHRVAEAARKAAADEKKAPRKAQVAGEPYATKIDMETLNKLVWELEKRIAALEERVGK